MMKTFITWTLAILITLVTAYYQRKTGPSYPKKVATELNGKRYTFKLERSHESSSSCEVRIPVNGNPVNGTVYFKRIPSNEQWDTLKMEKRGDDLVALLPAQPPAGKLQYFVELSDGKESRRLDGENSAIIRFTGDIPSFVLIPHIIMMFLAMLFSNAAGLMGAFRINRMRIYMVLTVIALFIGGFILGPIMQKFAFGEFWTGVPFGWDLTDNKTVIAMLVWVVALILNARKARPGWIIAAAVITLAVYLIPHSLFGSELNYTTGIVRTGQ
jgi:hypothetical protein